MKLVKHRKSLKVKNTDVIGTGGIARRRRPRHGELLPDSFRCLVVGPSDCGKTNVVLCLLLDENWLVFENVYLYTKTPHQPKYELLKKIFSKVKGLGYFVYSDADEIVRPDEARPNSIIIFDDIACENQGVVRIYFSMGRHNYIDSIYVCQSYSSIRKQLIRDNANVIVIFRVDELNLKHVYDDHVNTDMSFDQFKKLCALCWQEKYGFLVIVKDSEINNGRYRKGFDTFIKL